MKTTTYLFFVLLLTANAQAQSDANPTVITNGNLIYDQWSETNEFYPPNQSVPIQSNEPIGQSFIPSLSSVGFIRIFIADTITQNGSNATVYLNLLADSITGTVLAATEPLFLPASGFGYTNFFFAVPVAVTSGTTYYFQPVVDSQDYWQTELIPGFTYTNGTAYIKGVAPNQDLWFREGTYVIPEPSAAVLVLLGGGLVVWLRRRR